MYPMRTHCPVCGHLTARTSYSDAREYAHGLSVANGTCLYSFVNRVLRAISA